MPNYIVARGIGGRFEGYWYDYDQLSKEPVPIDSQYVKTISRVTLGPTGQYETRDDGAVAEVYRPA